MSPEPRILLCTCSQGRVLPPEPLAAVQNALRESRREVLEVDDLCQWAASRDERLQEVLEDGPVKIVACHTRAVKWLLNSAGVKPGPETLEIVSLRSLSGNQAVARTLSAEIDAADSQGPCDRQEGCRGSLQSSKSGPAEAAPNLASRGDWVPWFPVIDFDLCTHCMQCLNFCLFGVFGVREGRKVSVQNPMACKTQCPACARVCPEAAIIFPKFRSGPISGDVVTEVDLKRENMKVDLSSLLGGNLYHALRARTGPGAGRFSPHRDHEQALAEREKHLAALLDGSGLSVEDLKGMARPTSPVAGPRQPVP